MPGLWKRRLLRNGIIDSRSDRRNSCSGTGITNSTRKFYGSPTSGDATTIDDPTSCSSSICTSAPGFCHVAISGCPPTIHNPACCFASASTYDSNFASAFTYHCFTREFCFSTLNDNPCTQSSWSIAISKKTVTSFASTARFANSTTLNSGYATPFSPR